MCHAVENFFQSFPDRVSAEESLPSCPHELMLPNAVEDMPPTIDFEEPLIESAGDKQICLGKGLGDAAKQRRTRSLLPLKRNLDKLRTQSRTCLD